jgi:hypothetical protein
MVNGALTNVLYYFTPHGSAEPNRALVKLETELLIENMADITDPEKIDPKAKLIL